MKEYRGQYSINTREYPMLHFVDSTKWNCHCCSPNHCHSTVFNAEPSEAAGLAPVFLRELLFSCAYFFYIFVFIVFVLSLKCTPIVPLYDYSFNLGTCVHFVTVLVQGLMIIIIFLRACSNFFFKKGFNSLSKQSVYEHLWWPLPHLFVFPSRIVDPSENMPFPIRCSFFL